MNGKYNNSLTINIEINEIQPRPFALIIKFNGDPKLFERIVNVANEENLYLLPSKPIPFFPIFDYESWHICSSIETSNGFRISDLLKSDIVIRLNTIENAEKVQNQVIKEMNRFINKEAETYSFLLQGQRFYPASLPPKEYFHSLLDPDLQARLTETLHKVQEKMLSDNLYGVEMEQKINSLKEYLIYQSYITLRELCWGDETLNNYSEELFRHIVLEIGDDFHNLPHLNQSNWITRAPLIARAINVLKAARKTTNSPFIIDHEIIDIIPELKYALE